MPLGPGAKLGPYEVLAPLGAGGMGEVYRARDPRLGRDVAIKVLPAEVANDAERLARFRREAHLLASLNHPHVAAVHGLEELDGRLLLVLELVEGEDLAQRLKRGAIPVDEALGIANQIAEALEEAHEHGIVHRDLKPANIKLRQDGKVKVLDFGLAKAYSGEGDGEKSDLSHSPTLTRAGSESGVILGTAAYMSPEQARGKRVDKRADIWAFGVVLFEMLTGTRLIHGETVSDTLAAVLKTDPDWSLIPAETPERVRVLLRRCLVRDPKERLHDIADARLELAAVEDDATPRAPQAASQPLRRRALIWLLLPLGLVLGRLLGPPEVKPRRPTPHLEVPLPEGERLTSFRNALALSPDGSTLAFVSGILDASSMLSLYSVGGSGQIHVRAMDQWQSAPLPGTSGGQQPFFSPDGKWLGFVWVDPSGGAWPRPRAELRKIAMYGREPVTICTCDATYGASWGEDDTIVFGPSLGGLMRVPASGGVPQPLTELDAMHSEVNHRLPYIVPGGRAVLFTAILNRFDATDWGRARIIAKSLATGERKVLVEGASDARYVTRGEGFRDGGYLVFARGGRLYAAPFDVDRLELKGPEMPVLDGLRHSQNFGDGAVDTGAAQFSLSGSGALAYAAGSVAAEVPMSVVRVDRRGQEQILPVEKKQWLSVRLSPDGRQLLLGTLYPPMNVWVYDLERRTLRRQTFQGNAVAFPQWGPEVDRVTFSSDKDGSVAFFVKGLDSGPGAEQRLLSPGGEAWVTSWSPDGKHLAFVSNTAETGPAIWILDREGKTAPLMQSGFQEMYPEFSPDGRWIAYTSNESGRLEVYVRPYPGPGGVIQVSNAGGTEPAWSRDGREIVFRRNPLTLAKRTEFFSVTVAARSGRLAAGVPARLFEDNLLWSLPVRSWDITPDGHILGLKQPNSQEVASIGAELFPNRIRIIPNWIDELREKTATAR